MNTIFELKANVSPVRLSGELRSVYLRLKAMEMALFHATMWRDDMEDNAEYIASLSHCVSNEVNTLGALLNALEKVQGKEVAA